ncbi:MAG: hypothetical protein ACE5ES_00150 [Candidatus Nanoarchaeia archaeon]
MPRPRKVRVTVISNGMGMQSKLLSLLIYEKHPALKEYWNTPYIINVFADTQDEPDYIYQDLKEYQDYLKEHNYPELVIVSRGKISEDYYKVGIIPNRSKRRCTVDYKIKEIRKYIRSYLRKHNLRLKNTIINVLIGFTSEEFYRIRDSDVKYLRNRFPLIYDLKFTREDCINELKKRGLSYHKSGCWFCPFGNPKRFYDYVKNKVDLQEFVVKFEMKSRERLPNYYLFRKPVEQVLSGHAENIEDDSCSSGYCFV